MWMIKQIEELSAILKVDSVRVAAEVRSFDHSQIKILGAVGEYNIAAGGTETAE